jgi:plastocyanin
VAAGFSEEVRLRRLVPAWAFMVFLAGALVAAPEPVSLAAEPPGPEPNTAVDLDPRPCRYEGNDPFERRFYKIEGWKGPDYTRYPTHCRRLRFAFGPISVKPGQNDVLIEPVRLEKPMRDGYITRFEPNLVRPDGTVPPTERIHLHHGTWLSTQDYGSGPFFAAGEEKTVAPFPRGYGMPVKASDQWLLLYMVHSAVQQPMQVYITYDIDFVPQRDAEEIGLRPAYPIWLDVRPSGYPVFNVQRSFGGRDGECTWPKQKCAAFDPYGKQFTGQGRRGNGVGTGLTLPARGESLGRIESFQGGTLIGIGGHLHPGGLRNEIDLVRGRRSRRIYTGRAAYWSRRRQNTVGGPPTSWDFSMRVSGLPYWGVRVRPGDTLRSNATYDTRRQSTYENMGISIALLAPNTRRGKPTAPGVDPFRARADRSLNCRSRGLRGRPRRLCTNGMAVTHGPLPENDYWGGPRGQWTARRGVPTNGVTIADFIYAPGDLSMIEMTGVPTVSLGDSLGFTNLDGSAIYHTVTSCKFPCLGPTGTAFPLSNGRTSQGRRVDFDSSELGIGAPAIGPAKQELSWSLPVTAERGYRPGEIVTYFCRIHPGMRGAFEVTR